MSEPIGSLWTTKIPSLSETADIQEALRLYHYGAPSGTGSGEYNTTNTTPGSLISNSGVAYWLQSLRNDIDNNISSITSAFKASTFTAKGQLLSSSAASSLSILNVGSNDQVLTADSSTASGLAWKAPSVTLTNAIAFSNKTLNLSSNTLSGTLAQFNTALSDADFATLTGSETLTNKTLTSPVINLLTGTASTTSGRFVWNSTNQKITIGDGTTTQDFPSSTLVTNAQTGATYAIVSTDKDKLVELFNASTISVTVPTDATTFPIGSQINILQTGAGQASLIGSTVTSGVYFSGGLATSSQVTLNTYITAFAAGQTLTGTGFAANTIVSSAVTTGIASGTYYFDGANGATSVLIREYRPTVIANVLVTGANIGANTYVSGTSNTTTDTTTYFSGGASASTSVVVRERLPLVIAGQRLSGTGLTSNQTVSSVAESTITTATYASGGAAGTNTFVLADNANISSGQRLTGTGITGNVYVTTVARVVGTSVTITLGQNPVVSAIGSVSYSTYNLGSTASGTYTFYGASITFSPAANAQIAGSIAITGTTLTLSTPTIGQVSGALTFSTTSLNFSPAASSNISGTITASVTVNGTPGLKTRSQWSLITLIKRAASVWVATGDLVT